MAPETLTRRLSWFAISTCTLALIATVSVAAVPAARNWIAVAPARGRYNVGVPAGLPLDVLKSRPTIVVFFRPDCAPSQRSKAALSTVIGAAGAAGVDAVLITPSRDEDASGRFAEAIGLASTDVAQMNLTGLPVTGVPTVIVTRADRSVAFVHEGTLTDASVESMLPIVRSLGR